MGTYLPVAQTLGWAVWCGLGSLAPKVSLLIFIHHAWVWEHLLGVPTPLHVSTSPPHLDDVASLIPGCQTPIQLNFLIILDDISFIV